MKIIISPSKTMKPYDVIKPKSAPIFIDQATMIHDWISKLSIEEIMDFYNISEKLATKVVSEFSNFNHNQYPAIYTYQGTQYQYINLGELTIDDIQYMEQYIMIMSGLYGLLRAFDGISLYRMPMELSYQTTPLSHYWNGLLKDILRNELVINLCSDEYGVVLHNICNNLISVVFYQGVDSFKKVPSMDSKRLRGRMVHEIIKQKVDHIDQIRALTIDDWSYDAKDSSDTVFVFRKLLP